MPNLTLFILSLVALSYQWTQLTAFTPASIVRKAKCTAAPSRLSGPHVTSTALNLELGSYAGRLLKCSGTVPLPDSIAINVLMFTLFRPKLLSALTTSGYYNALALGVGLWTTLGWRGWSYCVVYLICGQLVTKVKFAEKEKKGIAEKRGGKRGPENVWGSAATSLACAVAAAQGSSFLGVSKKLYEWAFCAALATKLADTFASEIGKAYGKTTFLITNFKRVEPGTEGAISLEGTLAAVGGGLLLSSYGLWLRFLDVPGLVVSTLAAFLATNAESLIGATLQDRKGFGWMTNEVVNFINTLIGGGLAIAAGRFVLGMA